MKNIAIACAFIVLVTSELSVARSIETKYERTNHAEVARRLVHKSNWTSMSTISTASEFDGYPMVNIISVADSALDGRSTGHIYYMLTDLDFTGQDLRKLNRLTVLFTDDQDLSCTDKHIDSMEPICARVIIAGQNRILNETSDEYKTANAAFTNRHPASINWRNTHSFYLCELTIERIALLDYYGGPKFIKPEDYYAANYDDRRHNEVALEHFVPSVVSPQIDSMR